MTCPKCRSINVSVQAVAEQKKRGFFTTLFYIFLLLIPIIGWLALYSLVRGQKSKTISYAVCQNCGKRWKA